jgi:hypothetical protein
MFEKIKARVKERKLRKKKERLEEIQRIIDVLAMAAKTVGLDVYRKADLVDFRLEEATLKCEIRELEDE